MLSSLQQLQAAKSVAEYNLRPRPVRTLQRMENRLVRSRTCGMGNEILQLSPQTKKKKLRRRGGALEEHLELRAGSTARNIFASFFASPMNFALSGLEGVCGASCIEWINAEPQIPSSRSHDSCTSRLRGRPERRHYSQLASDRRQL